MTLLKRSSLRGTILRCRKKTHEEWIISIDILQVTLDFRAINIYRWSDDWWATFLNNFSCWKGHSCRYWIQTVPNTTHFEHFRGCDIPGTRIMRWLGLKKTPSRNNTWSQTSKPKVLPTRNVQSSKKKTRTCALEHHFKVTKSSLLDCFGHLWQLVRWPLYGWYSGLTRWVLGTGSSLTPMYVRMFIWHHLGGQFSQNHKMKKKALQKSYSHFAIQSEDMIFKEMWHAIVISPAKMPPPFPNAADPWSFSMGCCCNSLRMTTATPLPWHFGNPGSLEGFIGCWKVVYLTFPTVAARNAPGNQSGYTLVESLKHGTQKKHDIYTLSPFFLVGREGGHRKKKGTNQTQNRTAFCHHHPVDMDSVFSPTSPNVPPAFCECVASQGELGGFSCKTTDIMRPSKNDNFLGLEAWSSTSPTRNHAITA